jgi:hypothetical protein
MEDSIGNWAGLSVILFGIGRLWVMQKCSRGCVTADEVMEGSLLCPRELRGVSFVQNE